MSFISVTRLRLRANIYLPLFAWHARLSNQQVVRADGFRGGRLFGGPGRVFWTVTVWDSADAMRAYRNNGAHRAVMPHLTAWCDEASVAHWTQDGDTLPDWNEVGRRMQAGGRASTLARPSAAQAAGTFAPPNAPSPDAGYPLVKHA